MANNTQIDNTDYYRLPCGKYLEDFIYMREYSFAFGSAVKYAYRAGHKDGEPHEKDIAKMMHYVRFLAEREDQEQSAILQCVYEACDLAEIWNGMDAHVN